MPSVRSKVLAERPLFAVVRCHAASNHVVSGVCVLSKRVPAVTDAWWRHAGHTSRCRLCRHGRTASCLQAGQTKPPGHRSRCRYETHASSSGNARRKSRYVLGKSRMVTTVPALTTTSWAVQELTDHPISRISATRHARRGPYEATRCRPRASPGDRRDNPSSGTDRQTRGPEGRRAESPRAVSRSARSDGVGQVAAQLGAEVRVGDGDERLAALAQRLAVQVRPRRAR